MVTSRNGGSSDRSLVVTPHCGVLYLPPVLAGETLFRRPASLDKILGYLLDVAPDVWTEVGL